MNRSLSLLAATLTFGCLMTAPPVMSADKTDAVIGMLGLGCKNRVLEQFDVPNSDITIRLGATLQQNIDSGAMASEDLKTQAACFNWEVSGKNGAAKIAERMRELGWHFEWMVDEGGMIVSDNPMLPGKSVAMINVAEKGYLTLPLTATGRRPPF